MTNRYMPDFKTILVLCALSSLTEAAPSLLVPIRSDSTLDYVADAKGNRIPDFSHAGYSGGGATIPDIAVVVTIFAPASGDATSMLRNAIDQVGGLPVQANGFRGALLLKQGVYNVDRALESGHRSDQSAEGFRSRNQWFLFQSLNCGYHISSA